MIKEGTKVKIKEGLHCLVTDSVGTVLRKGKFPNTWEIEGESSHHVNRLVYNDLDEKEFEVIY